MFIDSQQWNLQEQYLMICIFFIFSYRIISFLIVYLSLPRYSYSKNVKKSKQLETQSDIAPIDSKQIEINQNGEIIQQSRSCFSYCWLQFFFDFGYIMELAPWLWNWELTKIILPEFAWFSKVSLCEFAYIECPLYTYSDAFVAAILSIRHINGCLIVIH